MSFYLFQVMQSKTGRTEIMKIYIDYYNSKRPHQGLHQDIPNGYAPQKYGSVQKVPIFGGLCHHYQRKAA